MYKGGTNTIIMQALVSCMEIAPLPIGHDKVVNI